MVNRSTAGVPSVEVMLKHLDMNLSFMCLLIHQAAQVSKAVVHSGELGPNARLSVLGQTTLASAYPVFRGSTWLSLQMNTLAA